MQFITLAELKQTLGIQTVSIVYNEKSQKKSILLPNGTFIKVQQNFDKSKPIAFMYENTVMDGCLINTTSPLTVDELL